MTLTFPCSLLQAECYPYSYCSRTPKYIIASSVAMGAAAGAVAGFATGNVHCGHRHCCKGSWEHDSCPFPCTPATLSEEAITLLLLPPSLNSPEGPLILVSIFRPDQSLFYSTTIGRSAELPLLPQLGGEDNPIQVGRWLVVFTVVAGSSEASDFGGIVVQGNTLRTLLIASPQEHEEQQLTFCQPFPLGNG